MPRTVCAIRHIDFEDMGSLETLLKEKGWGIHYYDAATDDLSQIEARNPDLLVVLGGPIGAYEEDDYPFLNQELEIIKQRLDADKPLIGICLGGQLIARALGQEVYPGNNGKEIGWAPLTLTEEGKNSCLKHLIDCDGYVLHWHGDTFDMPEGATHLATSEKYANQAFTYGKALAFQCHPEIEKLAMEKWLVGHTATIAETPDLSVKGLRSETKEHAPKLEKVAQKIFSAWLDEVGLEGERLCAVS